MPLHTRSNRTSHDLNSTMDDPDYTAWQIQLKSQDFYVIIIALTALFSRQNVLISHVPNYAQNHSSALLVRWCMSKEDANTTRTAYKVWLHLKSFSVSYLDARTASDHCLCANHSVIIIPCYCNAAARRLVRRMKSTRPPFSSWSELTEFWAINTFFIYQLVHSTDCLVEHFLIWTTTCKSHQSMVLKNV